MLEGPRLAEEYSTSSAFALETSFCRARPVAFNDFFGNGSQSGVHRQAAKITGAGNGTGGRDARKRKNQSIRFLRRLIPILLSGSPLGSANMHSKRTFRLVVFAARAPIGTTGGLLLRGVRKCDTRSYELSLFTAWVPVRSPESDARNDFRSLQLTSSILSSSSPRIEQ